MFNSLNQLNTGLADLNSNLNSVAINPEYKLNLSDFEISSANTYETLWNKTFETNEVFTMLFMASAYNASTNTKLFARIQLNNNVTLITSTFTFPLTGQNDITLCLPPTLINAGDVVSILFISLQDAVKIKGQKVYSNIDLS